MSKRMPQFEDGLTMEQFTGADFREAENLLVFSAESFLPEQKRRCRRVFLKNLTTGEIRQITAGGVAEEQPLFSPDGKQIAFLAVLPGKGRQLCVYDRESEQTRVVTAMRSSVMDPVWSPDGSRMLFLSPTGSGGKPPAPDEPIVVENLNYKFDGRGFYRPDSFLQLWVADMTSGECVCITSGPHHHMHHNWLPDGKSVICGSNCYRRPEESIGMDLIRIDLTEGFPITRLSDGEYLVSYPNPVRPVCTPDGRFVIAGFLNLDPAKVKYMESVTYPEVYAYRVRTDGSGKEQIFAQSKEACQCVQFPYNASCGANMDTMQISEDGRTVYYLAGWQGRTVLYALQTDAGTPQQPRVVLSEKCAVNGLSRVQHGKMLISVSTETEPESYRLLDLQTGSCSQPLVQCAQDLLDTVQYTQPEDFFFDTLDGDSRVHGWVIPPAQQVPGKKYPAILYIHGGPQPFYTYGFVHEFQCLAAAGFAVLYCNFRGSTSYGWNHAQIRKAYGVEAYTDNLQFVDEACRRFDWIDSDRIGVTGGSYGGYMTNYIAAHSKRFQAYVTQRSVVNHMIMYASSDMSALSRDYKSFDEFMAKQLYELSPVVYADQIDKPFLILHGTEDLRTPVEGAHQLYTAIKDTHPDLPVKMVLFPHTAHSQPKNPALLLRYEQEMLQWFKTWLSEKKEGEKQ